MKNKSATRECGVSACAKALKLTGAQELFPRWPLEGERCRCLLPLGELSAVRLPFVPDRWCKIHGWTVEEWERFFRNAQKREAETRSRAGRHTRSWKGRTRLL